mmetsp:Transcript_16694/g.35389  ORF Transcript_16694/g.35389 Transcript_16694/m.35389 type:complete len:582 (-) Transcript_16694:176-1921(-)
MPAGQPAPAVQPVRVEVGMTGGSVGSKSSAGHASGVAGVDSTGGGTGSGGVRKWIEEEELPIEPLPLVSRFPWVLAAFCSLRLLRPVLLAACFPDGPQSRDVGANFAIACAWLSPLCGFLAALALCSPLREFVRRQNLPQEFTTRREEAALGLLAIALAFDCLHQLLALVRWSFFWSTGVLEEGAETDWRDPFAHVLVMLHIVGLLGAVIIVATYARNYRVALKRMLEERRAKNSGSGEALRSSGAEAKDSAQRDLERGKPAVKTVGSSVGGSNSGSGSGAGRPPSAPATATAAGPKGPRQAASDQSDSVPPPKATEPPEPPRSSSSTSAQPQGVHGARPGSAGSGQPFGSPSRAWLWANGEWVRVRVLRSTGDGSATVRLSGGAVVQTRQAFLRSRSSEDEEPPTEIPQEPPPKPGSRGRPSSAGASTRPPPGPTAHTPRPERPSSAGDGGSRGGTAGAGADAAPPRGAPGPGPSAGAAGSAGLAGVGDEKDSIGAQWAETRMERLRKELIDLDRCEGASARRSRLRALQRELHPDKQPPELRAHAQPLFHLVQREWELVERAATNTASKTSAPPSAAGA